MSKNYKLNTNHSNNAFNKEIDNISAAIKLKKIEFPGFSKDVLVDRLMQRIVELSLETYVKIIQSRFESSKNVNHLPTSGESIVCKNICFEVGTGYFYVTFGQWLVNQIDFLKHWSFLFLAIIFSKLSSNNKPATMVYGMGPSYLFADGSDKQFVNYCNNAPVAPLKNGERYIVQSSLGYSSSEPDRFKYCRRPIIELLREVNLGVFGRSKLLIKHIALFFSYNIAALKIPQLTLLNIDFAYSKIFFELDNRDYIESIILTNSLFLKQELSLRMLKNSEVHMIWYSQNLSEITYISDKLMSVRPGLRWIRADKHWVWTNSFANYLKSIGVKYEVEAVGPIIWCLPEFKKNSSNVIKIAIFDDSPFSNDVAMANGELSNYYHPDNMFKYLNDIISIKETLEEGLNVSVIFHLKTKRGYKELYDKPYFEYLEHLHTTNIIKLVSHTINTYSFITQSNIVISYPFGTPAYIAEALEVPSIYYDPTNSIVKRDFSDNKQMINFANDIHQLSCIIKSVLSDDSRYQLTKS